MSVVGWNWAGPPPRLPPLQALPAARALMAIAATLAPMVTVALPFIYAVRLSAGKAVLSPGGLMGALAPVALAWAFFGFTVVVFLAVRREAED